MMGNSWEKFEHITNSRSKFVNYFNNFSAATLLAVFRLV